MKNLEVITQRVVEHPLDPAPPLASLEAAAQQRARRRVLRRGAAAGLVVLAIAVPLAIRGSSEDLTVSTGVDGVASAAANPEGAIDDDAAEAEAPSTEVPPVIGLPPGTARQVLVDAGLTVSGIVDGDSTPGALVAATRPSGGDVVDAGTEVTLVLTQPVENGDERQVPSEVLARDFSGPRFTTAFAGDMASYEDLLDLLGLDLEPRAVDFSESVVVYFGTVKRPGCGDPEYRIIYRMDDGRIFADELSSSEGAQGCPDFPVAHGLLVALGRGTLPRDPFELWIDGGSDECCPGGVTIVQLD